jgi:streptogramin lyase
VRLLGAVLTIVAVAAALTAGPAAAGPTITEFPAGSGPWGVARGADGNVWFADAPNPGAIGRVTPGGTVTTFAAGLTKDAQPKAIVGAPSGVWFTENGKNRIGRVAADGTITEFSGGTHDHPTGIAAGPDGNVWYVAAGKGGAVARITAGGTVTEYTAGLTPNGNLQDIVLGPDGNLWFTAPATGRIGRITPQGVVTEFDGTGLLAGSPQQIAAGPDGNLWFTVGGVAPAIGRITPAGVMTQFTTGLLVTSSPTAIDAGADGNVYFTDSAANAIGRVTPSGAITEITTGIMAFANLQGLATGGDGRVWFAESGKAKVGRLSVAPTAGATSASGVTGVDADLAATVTPNSEATTYHFEWGTTTGYGQSTATASAGSGASAQAVGTSLTGVLAPTTTYHARLVATNGTGTTYGPDHTFTTTATGAPSATTLPVSDVAAGAATLDASVNPENAATTYHFDWGATEAYGHATAETPLAPVDQSGHDVSAVVSGLEPNTTYHFRVVATSSGGTTYGADRAFTTDAIAPQAITSAATAVTADAAVLAGEVDPGHSATTYHFEWGTTDAYGSSVPAVDALVGDDHAPHVVTQPLTGLAPSTTYHFRVVATSNAGVTVGGEQQLTTAGVAPDAATVAADAITATTATLHAAVNPHNDPATTYRFEWGPTSAYGSATSEMPIDGAVDETSREERADIGGLVPGTLYHYRVVATSPSGTTPGQDAFFTSAPSSGSDPNGGVPVPQLGRTAVVSAAAGTIRVRLPGSAKVVVLTGAAAIPSGSVVDARAGTLMLDTALDARGRRQAARFHGAIFRLSLAKKGGMVDLTLTQRPSGCVPARARPRSASAARAKKPPVSLWGKDSKGKYRTHGRNSVATVRGTEWVTTETCSGTLTGVVKGAVSVLDLRTHRTKLVRAGHRYLARARR